MNECLGRDALLALARQGDYPSLQDFFRGYFEASATADDYYFGHINRYARTAHYLPAAAKPHARALELGATAAFQEFLRAVRGFDEVHGTDFHPDLQFGSQYREFDLLDDRKWYMSHNTNIEDNPLPFEDGYFDLIMCCEVIEHMERDPMYLISEINRVLTAGGRLLLTTPNSASGRVLWSILNGYRPHFFMQYPKDRSLYKHNFEYDCSAARALVEAGGFAMEQMDTIDTFADPVPEALTILESLGLPTAYRGDNIYIVAQKTGAVRERYPDSVYY